jgi:AraC family transcriptional regulator, positive regulator of tynA and feaB
MRRAKVGAASPRSWSTAAVPESEQFAFWREVVWQAFVPVSLRRDREGPFLGAVTARYIGSVGVSTIESDQQSVTRTHDQVQRQRGDVYFLNLPFTEGSSACQGGRTARLSPGDFTIVDGSRPFDLNFERGFSQLSLMLPHDVLAPKLAAPNEITAVRVRGDSGVGAIASATLRSLSRSIETFDRFTAHALIDQVAGLVALALGRVETPRSRASRALLRQAVLDEIERSLGDSQLSPALVAERIGISTRYLHQLLADRGPSFGRWVLIRRLERCHRDLTDPARAHWTIAELAIHHGFNDPSYFARAFRSRYGIAPREVRRRELAGARISR